MENFNNLTDALQQTFFIIFYKAANFLPNVLGGIIILIAGWIIARSLRFITIKALAKPFLKNILDKIATYSFRSQFTRYNLANILAGIVYWFTLLFFVVFVSEALGWTTVSQELSKVIDYLPRLFTACFIFLIGIYLANFVKKFVSSAFEVLHNRSRVIASTVIYYFLLILVTITALDQAGINTHIISSNMILIVGSFLLAFSLAFGLGAQHTLSNLLATLYARRLFSEGDKIKIDDKETQILKIEDVSVVLKTGEGKIIIPTKTFMNSKVEILTQ